jgi:hypothetical protein
MQKIMDKLKGNAPEFIKLMPILKEMLTDKKG